MAAATVTGTVLTDPKFKINSKDLSAYVTSINFDNSKEMFMSKASGKTGQARFPGIIDQNVKVTLHQNYAAGEVDATLRGIIGSAVEIIIGQSSFTAGPTNPVYTFYGMFTNYDMFGGGQVTQPQDITLDIFLADGVPATAVVS
jgi:hypothetical protein